MLFQCPEGVKLLGRAATGLNQRSRRITSKSWAASESRSNAESPCSMEKGVQGNPAAYKNASHGGEMMLLVLSFISCFQKWFNKVSVTAFCTKDCRSFWNMSVFDLGPKRVEQYGNNVCDLALVDW